VASGELDYSIDLATPEELWDRLSEAVKARINLRAGTILEWWTASSADGRPAATVLGTNALIRVEPTSNGDGALVNRITTVALDASSFRRARVLAPPGWQGPRSPAAPPARRRSEFIDVFAHLPPEAQQHLRYPFADSPPDTLRRDQYYSQVRMPGHREPGGVTLRVWYCLTDQRSVAFATGLGHGFRRGAGADSWDVTCWQAAVQQPAG
jgi:hypothetical protein